MSTVKRIARGYGTSTKSSRKSKKTVERLYPKSERKAHRESLKKAAKRDFK